MALPVLLQVPGGAELVVIGLVLLLLLVVSVLWIGTAYWVYADASRRGMDNATLWGVVTFFVGIPGVVVYFLARE